MIKHGFPPLPPLKKVDTLKIAKKHFSFTSNKLEYLANYLEVEVKKSAHAKYPGMELWNACMEGDKEAFKEMESYNRTDVIVLEGVYNKLIPYEPSIKFSAFHLENTCTCGSKIFVKDGLNYTAKGAFQRYRCKQCGKFYSESANLIDKDRRKELFK
jgi:DNA-directed RNA polymerase subunit RPC12/RpoP